MAVISSQPPDQLKAAIVMCQGIGFGPIARMTVHRPRTFTAGIEISVPAYMECYAETKEGVALELVGNVSWSRRKVDGVTVFVVRCDEVIVLEEMPC